MNKLLAFLLGLFFHPKVKKAGKVTAIGTATALAVAGLAQWEGMDLRAKHQRIDPKGVITACIGETNMDDPSLKAGQRFTVKQCKERLARDLPKYIAMVDACVSVDVPPHRKASLIMFVYNLGKRALCRSRVAYYLNRGNVKAGCNAMMAYTHANGRFLQGLANRRKFERNWCLRND